MWPSRERVRIGLVLPSSLSGLRPTNATPHCRPRCATTPAASCEHRMKGADPATWHVRMLDRAGCVIPSCVEGDWFQDPCSMPRQRRGAVLAPTRPAAPARP